MRHNIKIPRVLKINWVKELSVAVIFNNGESRIIDFALLFKELGIDIDSPAFILNSHEEFQKVELQNNTLSWPNFEQYIHSKNNEKIRVPFEIGSDILLKFSYPEEIDYMSGIGKMVRDARIKAGMTQQDLAILSGTTRSYISRIENNRSDIELATLSKIIETGLGHKLEINIKKRYLRHAAVDHQ